MSITLLSLDHLKNTLQKRTDKEIDKSIEIAGKRLLEALSLVDTQLAKFRFSYPRTEFEQDVILFLLEHQSLAGSDGIEVLGSIKSGRKEFKYCINNYSNTNPGQIFFTMVR